MLYIKKATFFLHFINGSFYVIMPIYYSIFSTPPLISINIIFVQSIDQIHQLGKNQSMAKICVKRKLPLRNIGKN